MVKSWRKEVNDNTPPPVPHCIKWDAFLLQSRTCFVSEDVRLRQPRKTLAYAKLLQFWADKVQPPRVGEPCQLMACVQKLKEVMEPFITFMDEDVLNDYPPSPWEKITSSLHSGAAEKEVQESMQKGGYSQNRRAHPQVCFPTTSFLGCTKPLIIPAMKQLARRVRAPSIFTEKVKMPPGSPVSEKRIPLPGFHTLPSL